MNEAYQSSTNKPQVNNVVLEYLTPVTVRLDLPFISTFGKTLVLGMPYMLLEGNRSTAVKLLSVRDAQGFVYLFVQNLQTHRTFELRWNLEYRGSYWLWSLADYETLSNLTK